MNPYSSLINFCEKVKAKLRQGWTKRDFARDASGNGVFPTSQEACCWCVMGAALAVDENDGLYNHFAQWPKTSWAVLNDQASSVDDVIMEIDRMIESLRGAENGCDA